MSFSHSNKEFNWLGLLGLLSFRLSRLGGLSGLNDTLHIITNICHNFFLQIVVIFDKVLDYLVYLWILVRLQVFNCIEASLTLEHLHRLFVIEELDELEQVLDEDYGVFQSLSRHACFLIIKHQMLQMREDLIVSH